MSLSCSSRTGLCVHPVLVVCGCLTVFMGWDGDLWPVKVYGAAPVVQAGSE